MTFPELAEIEPRPAATLILFREAVDGAPELLMVERAASMKFAGGALVFPGGAVDPGDQELAGVADHGLHPEDAVARVAAIRETLEESGIAIGITPVPDEATAAALRAGIEAGRDFGGLLAEAGLALDLTQLVLFAHWLPQGRQGIPRFDTRFYLAQLSDAQEASVDETENVRLVWTSARGALDSQATIIFPTRRNLERLALFADFAAACDQAAAFPAQRITPFMEERADGMHLCIPTDRGYPVTAQLLADVMRG